jgi:hypothetical protein
MAHISNGLAFQNKNGELWAAPYLHLIHGDVLLQQGSPEQAVSSYQRALEAAQQTGARLLALRSAVRICRTEPEQTFVRPILQDLWSHLTEGFQTQEFLEAATCWTDRRERSGTGKPAKLTAVLSTRTPDIGQRTRISASTERFRNAQNAKLRLFLMQNGTWKVKDAERRSRSIQSSITRRVDHAE